MLVLHHTGGLQKNLIGDLNQRPFRNRTEVKERRKKLHTLRNSPSNCKEVNSVQN